MLELKLKLEGIFGDNVDIKIENMGGGNPVGQTLIINNLLFICEEDGWLEVWDDGVQELFYFQTEDELFNFIKTKI
jgi:hypothetical protein